MAGRRTAAMHEIDTCMIAAGKEHFGSGTRWVALCFCYYV